MDPEDDIKQNSEAPLNQEASTGLHPDEDLQKEVNLQRKRYRHNKRWKDDVERVANKISSVFKKPGKHGGSESPSFASSRQSERSVAPDSRNKYCCYSEPFRMDNLTTAEHSDTYSFYWKLLK